MKRELQVIKCLLPWLQLQSSHLQPICPISTTQTPNQQPRLGVKLLLLVRLTSRKGNSTFHPCAVNPRDLELHPPSVQVNQDHRRLPLVLDGPGQGAHHSV